MNCPNCNQKMTPDENYDTIGRCVNQNCISFNNPIFFGEYK